MSVYRSGTQPLVSIIVPSYNHGRYLRQTLDSILVQDYRPLEVLVMDGLSSDNTIEILREYAARFSELRWWSEQDNGPADAVNKGLAKAAGEIAGIQSSDDYYFPGAISSVVAAFAQHPEASIVYGDDQIVDEQGRSLRKPSDWPQFTLARYLCRCTFIAQNSAFFRLGSAREVGGWRSNYFVADIDFWLRMVFRAPAFKISQVLSAWRKHEQQRNSNAARIWADYWRMIEESPEIRAAPLHLRLAAEAGRRILIEDYAPDSRWLCLYQVWRAVLTYPPAIGALHNKRILVPGIGRLTKAYERLTRMIRRPSPSLGTDLKSKDG